MDLDMLEGEIVAIEDTIKMELEFSTFDEEESEIPEISECVVKLEKLKEELVEKMMALKDKEPAADQTSSKETLRKVADTVEELRKLKQRLNEAIERKEKDKRAKKEEIEIEIERENSRIAELVRKFEEQKAQWLKTHSLHCGKPLKRRKARPLTLPVKLRKKLVKPKRIAKKLLRLRREKIAKKLLKLRSEKKTKHS